MGKLRVDNEASRSLHMILLPHPHSEVNVVLSELVKLRVYGIQNDSFPLSRATRVIFKPTWILDDFHRASRTRDKDDIVVRPTVSIVHIL